MKKILIGSLAMTSIILNAGCGSSSSSSSSASTSSIANTPILAVTSPTSSSSSTSAFRMIQHKTLLAKVTDFFSNLIAPSLVAAESAPTTEGTYTQKVNELKNDIAGGATGMMEQVGNLYVSTNHAKCFGPSWQDDATGSNVNRPSFDTGMVYATASDTDTIACSAAEMNALVNGMPSKINDIIRIAAAAALAAGLPAAGAEVDATASMPPLTGVTWTSVKIKRLADDSSGNKNYKTTIAASTTAQNQTRTMSVTLYHTPTNADNTNFKGLVQAILPHVATMGASGTYRGLSMIYSSTDGVVNYLLETAANRTTNSTDFFSATTGRIDFSKTAAGEDFFKILAKFDSTNASAVVGTMHEAWQAGSGDGATRNFAATVNGTTGSAYFGFGSAMTTLTDATTSPWATKMHCNWLNGLSSSPSITKIQAQTVTLDTTTGKYIPGTNAINFAPTDTCAKSGTYTVSNAAYTFLNGSRSGTNELITYGDTRFSAVPAVTVPTYTIPTE